MKILLANKFYYRRGGDCIYMLNLEQMLKEHGHEVAIFAMDYPENIDTPWKKYFPREVKFRPGLGMIETFIRPFGLGEVQKKFTALLDDFKPDVVHLNNIHTQLSPVIAEIAHKRGIKVVWTLHDYKLLCPRYDCLRNGKTVCEECFSDKHKVLDYNCMKNSKLASIIAYKEATTWNRERLEACTDAFICPSQFMKKQMEKGGFLSSKLHHIPNFIDVSLCNITLSKRENYYCYVGRISNEKGLGTLIEAANEDGRPLIVIGDGRLRKDLQNRAKRNISFVGFRQWEEIKEIICRAKFCVTPSEWFEMFGLVNIEALCLGTPILGANIGGIPELIDDSNGMTFVSGDVEDLKDKISRMFEKTFDYKQIAARAQAKYNVEEYNERLKDICQSILPPPHL